MKITLFFCFIFASQCVFNLASSDDLQPELNPNWAKPETENDTETGDREARTIIKHAFHLFYNKVKFFNWIKLFLIGTHLLGKETIIVDGHITTTTTISPSISTTSRRPEVTTEAVTSTGAPINTTGAVLCYTDSDLILVVDSSGSVNEDYPKALQFASSLAEAWKVHSGNRISVMLFSDNIEAILTAPFHDGLTEIYLALDAARAELLKHNRPSTIRVPRNIVAITDGVSNPVLTETAADRLYKLQDVRGFAIGIGSSINFPELLSITMQKHDRVFTVTNFDKLIDVVRPISFAACEKLKI